MDLKKNYIGKALFVGGVSLTLCGQALMLSTPIMNNIVSVAHADQVAPTTTNIEIHKTMYDKADASFFEQEQNKIKNDGTQKESTFNNKLFH